MKKLVQPSLHEETEYNSIYFMFTPFSLWVSNLDRCLFFTLLRINNVAAETRLALRRAHEKRQEKFKLNLIIFNFLYTGDCLHFMFLLTWQHLTYTRDWNSHELRFNFTSDTFASRFFSIEFSSKTSCQ